jgi:hypothetical protein
MSAPAAKRLIELFQGVHLDLDLHAVGTRALGSGEPLRPAIRDRQVVVLDQHARTEVGAVVRTAAGPDRQPLERAAPGKVLRVSAMRARVPAIAVDESRGSGWRSPTSAAESSAPSARRAAAPARAAEPEQLARR